MFSKIAEKNVGRTNALHPSFTKPKIYFEKMINTHMLTCDVFEIIIFKQAAWL